MIKLKAYAREPAWHLFGGHDGDQHAEGAGRADGGELCRGEYDQVGSERAEEREHACPGGAEDDRSPASEPVRDDAGGEGHERADPHGGEHRALVASRRAELFGHVGHGLREERADVAIDQREDAQQSEHGCGPRVRWIGGRPPRPAIAA